MPRRASHAKATEVMRAQDRQVLDQWRDLFARSIGRMDGIVERGQAADRQWQHRLWCVAGGAVGGILLWSALPGMVARALPESWHVPEWMAARTMGLAMPVAGERMLRVAHPDIRTAVPAVGERPKDEPGEPHAARKPRNEHGFGSSR